METPGDLMDHRRPADTTMRAANRAIRFVVNEVRVMMPCVPRRAPVPSRSAGRSFGSGQKFFRVFRLILFP